MAVKGVLEICPYENTNFKTVFVPLGKKVVWLLKHPMNTQTETMENVFCYGYHFVDDEFKVSDKLEKEGKQDDV